MPRRSNEEVLKTLSLIGHGEMLDEIGDSLIEGEKALGETSKPYEITIKIKVGLNGGKKRVVTGSVNLKKPKVAGVSTYVFVTDQGQFVESDPDQRELPLNVAKPNFSEPKVAEAPAPAQVAGKR